MFIVGDNTKGQFLLECEADAAEMLHRKFRMHRLRRKVDLDIAEKGEYAVYAATGEQKGLESAGEPPHFR